MIMTVVLEDEQLIFVSTYSPTLVTQSQYHPISSLIAVSSIPCFVVSSKAMSSTCSDLLTSRTVFRAGMTANEVMIRRFVVAKELVCNSQKRDGVEILHS